MKTYVDVAKRLHLGTMVRLEKSNGDRYMGEVASVRPTTDGNVIVTLDCPSVFYDKARFPSNAVGLIDVTVTPTVRVDPQ